MNKGMLCEALFVQVDSVVMENQKNIEQPKSNTQDQDILPHYEPDTDPDRGILRQPDPDCDAFPGILPCQGREEGLYPAVGHNLFIFLS